MARKQVGRNRSDPGMFIVTYTAEHSHPAPSHRNSLAGTTRHKTSPTEESEKPCSDVKPTSSSPTTPAEDDDQQQLLLQGTAAAESKEVDLEMIEDEEDNDESGNCDEFSPDAPDDDFFVGLEELTSLAAGDCYSKMKAGQNLKVNRIQNLKVKSARKKNVRGISICKAVARLKRGEKLPIAFYNNHQENGSRRVGQNLSICGLQLRSVLYREYAKPCGSEEEAVENKPDAVGNQEDWEWCVKHVFYSPEFQAGLVETCEANPELEPIELVEEYYGEQRHGHIIGFGGGLRPKDLKGSDALSRAELASKLRESNGEKTDMATVIAEQAKVISEMRDMMERMNQRSAGPAATQNG
ncbi:unnamed protein product [Linum tenue]|uniref:WRKY domain-containing protein n=1 Tax=Linum tenue TaxID=586396 RepID=A0AAV0KKQ4_9ROSI|nr:unnamed protein product [Linum tenue]